MYYENNFQACSSSLMILYIKYNINRMNTSDSVEPNPLFIALLSYSVKLPRFSSVDNNKKTSMQEYYFIWYIISSNRR